MGWERVYTINEYYDGPRQGVADFGGLPHVYKSIFDDLSDDWSDEFLLMEISPDLLKYVLEQWTIWLRWREAFDAGKTTIETHPMLASDEERAEEIKQLVGDRLAIQPAKAKKMKARFRGVSWSKADAQTEVEWSPV